MRPITEHSKAQKTGVIAALAAFLFWGLAPFYFKALPDVSPTEIIMHRIVWSIPTLALFLLYRDGRALLRNLRLPPRLIGALLISSLLVSFNWLVFVWAVMNGQVMSTSLGYFINPLVNVLLGFLFLGERLSRLQTAAVALAAAGTLYLGWYIGQPPWISLALGFSFGLYGLVRKRLPVGPMTGLMWEMLVLSPVALGFLAWLAARGDMSFLGASAQQDVLLVLAGLLTVLPLIWFNMAAQRLRLSVLGFFMYIAPSMTLLFSVFLWNEPFTRGHAVAFGCIWTALALISLETVNRMQRERRTRGAAHV